MHDLGPAARELARLVVSIRDDQLDERTPCAEYTLADLLDHVLGFTTAFIANAHKQPRPPEASREVDGRLLPPDWQAELSKRLDELAAAWRDESAWQGKVSAGGIDMSAEDNALVATEELVMHGWDVARATGQDFSVDDASLSAVDRFMELFGERIASGQGPYGPAVAVPDDASHLDRLLGATGRDPGWSSLDA
jgi:uncharacterized protein (TIGR03086 family)